MRFNCYLWRPPNNKKMTKVLIIINESNASEYFRCILPGFYLFDNHKKDIDITIRNKVDVWDIHGLAYFDIIHFHRHFGWFESAAELFPMLQKAGVKLVMDMDDYWLFPDYYTYAEHLRYNNIYGKELDNIKLVDHVTVTTELFAEVVLKETSNVTVLPNAVDMNDTMWDFEHTDSEICRIGWLGSHQRNTDLKRLAPAIKKLYADEELQGKFQMVLCGGDEKDREIFDGPMFLSLPLLPVDEYGVYYNEIDICLAPLEHNDFNNCKSELKLIEAGMNKKAFVGECFGIYKNTITHMEDGLLVDDSDQWFLFLKDLILNKSLREQYGENLYNTVKDKFSIKTVAKQRIKFYNSLINGK